MFCGMIDVQIGPAQGADQNCSAEGSAETCGQNEGAQASPAGGNGVQGADQGSEAQAPASSGSNGEGAAQSDNAGGPAQTSAPNGGAEAPAQSGGKAASSAQSGNAQTPDQSNRPQAAGGNATPAGTNAEIQQSGPQEIQQPSPYGDMQSLHDLYTQVPSSGGKLQRFGSDAFLLGTGNANELPMDLPAGPDYVLGPGDSLIVNMWGGQSSRLNRIIDRQGQIDLPEAGTIMINGMTIAQAQSAIQQALSTQFQSEHVEISLGRLRTVRVYVVGDVQRPGAYDVSSLSTPLSALYAAGGPTSRGSSNT